MEGISSTPADVPVTMPTTISSVVWTMNALTCANPTDATARAGSTPWRWTKRAFSATEPKAGGATSDTKSPATWASRLRALLSVSGTKPARAIAAPT